MSGRFDWNRIGVEGAIAAVALGVVTMAVTPAAQEMRRDEGGRCVVAFGDRDVSVAEMRRALDEGCEERSPTRSLKVVGEEPACPGRTSLAFDFRFAFDSADLSPAAEAQLGRIASLIGTYPDCRVVLEGHTDATGSETYNLGLSERRAFAVRDRLVSAEVSPDRLAAIGLGETRLLTPEDPGAGANRRVEIMIMDQ